MPAESEKIYLGFTQTDHPDGSDKKGLDQNYISFIKRPLKRIKSYATIRKFGLASLFNGISTLFRLFNAKAIFLEEQ